MKEKIKHNKYKLMGGMIIGVLMIIFVTGLPVPTYIPDPENIDEGPRWHIDWEGSLTDLIKADYNPTGTGFRYICGVLDTETMETFLTTNRTSAQMSVHASCTWLADTDAYSEECVHTTEWYPVIKVEANDSIYHDADWNESRIRCTLTFSGLDTAITTVTEVNDSGTAGDWVKSSEVGSTSMFGYFFWAKAGPDGYYLGEGDTGTQSYMKIETYY